MIDFLKTYWRLIVEAVALIISFVLFLIRKKPIKLVDSLKQSLVLFIPQAVNIAEKSGFKGAEKLSYSLQVLYEVFAKDIMSYSDYLEKYSSFLTEQVEAVLSTPRKKGENNG